MLWSRMTPSRTITAVLAVCAGLAACDEGPAGTTLHLRLLPHDIWKLRRAWRGESAIH